MKKQTFFSAVFILAIAGIIAKFLGAIYRVPLTWILGAEGLGIYQLIFPIFSLLLVISSTGMPIVISKMVAKSLADGEPQKVKKILYNSIILLGGVGIAFGIILSLLSGVMANIQGNSQAILGYLAIAPAIFFVAILSVYRGYFQGMQNFFPTAISQIVEQGAKLIFGLLFSLILMPFGVQFGVLGAILGVSVSEVLAVGLMLWFIKKNKQKKDMQSINYNKQNFLHLRKLDKSVIKEIILTALPIITTTIIFPLLMVVDSLIIITLLNQSGLTFAQSTIVWGINSGVVNSLINLPIAITMAIAIAVVPNVATLGKNFEGQFSKAIYLTLTLVLPIFEIFILLAPDILLFLYQDSLGGVSEFVLAQNLLILLSVVTILGSILQVQTATLQGAGLGKVPLINLSIAGGIKLLITLLLVPLPYINIYGYTVANIIFYLVAVLLNKMYFTHKLKINIKYSNLLPNVAGCASIFFFILNCNYWLPNISIYISLTLQIAISVLLYIGTLWCFGAIKNLQKVWQIAKGGYKAENMSIITKR